jgi:hypothetical protein
MRHSVKTIANRQDPQLRREVAPIQHIAFAAPGHFELVLLLLFLPEMVLGGLVA